MSSTRTQSQFCAATLISSFVQLYDNLSSYVHLYEIWHLALNKRWNWSSCTKLALSGSWTHGLIAHSVRASERNSVLTVQIPFRPTLHSYFRESFSGEYHIYMDIYIKDCMEHFLCHIMALFKRKAFTRTNLCLEHFKRQLKVRLALGKNWRKWFIQGNDDFRRRTIISNSVLDKLWYREKSASD